MHRIVLIIPFVGELPKAYFSIFLRSCGHNTQIDFLIFSDRAQEEMRIWGQRLPTNVQILPLTLAEFNERASTALGVKVQATNGYKLCDLRPMYADIFAEYVADYHFWGYCDLDVILGDLSVFLTPELLNTHDIISLRREWLSGSFSLYRNVPRLNKLYTRSESWQRVAESSTHFRFDEIGVAKGTGAMIYSQVAKGTPLENIENEIESITHVLRRTEREDAEGLSNCAPLRIHWQTVIRESIPEGMVLQYQHGRIFVYEGFSPSIPKDLQFALYHYISEKNNGYFVFPYWQDVPESFFIDNTGFYNKIEFQRDRASMRRRRRLAGYWRYYTRTLPAKVWRKLRGN